MKKIRNLRSHLGFKKAVFKAVSALIAVSVCVTGIQPPAFAARPASASQAVYRLPSDLSRVNLPEALGEIQEFSDGKEKGAVVLIQDAHSVPEAQKNIRLLIEHFEKTYGLSYVALEGASSKLDPQIFKSFPDRGRLEKVLEAYSDRGELAGGVAAAILNSAPAVYEGVEDWKLYEEGLTFYRRAMESERKLSAKIKKQRTVLENKKQKIYPPKLRAVDAALLKFYSTGEGFDEVLTELAAVRPPERGGVLEALLREIYSSNGKNLNDEIARAVKAVNTARLPADQRKNFNDKRQAFQTSLIDTREFAVFLKDFASRNRIPVSFSPDFEELARRRRRLQDLQGSKVLREFESYARSVKASLFENRGQVRLDEASRRLDILEKLARLELSREEWREFQKSKDVSAAALQNHIHFYRNAERRETAFWARLQELVREKKGVIFVSGGFHTEGMKEKLKEAGIACLVAAPKIGTVPDASVYRAQMRGEVSWKNYFKPENGRLSVSDAFIRSVRDDLLRTGEGRGVLKSWRDQVIRDLAEREETGRAHVYLKILDEVFENENSAYLNSWKAGIDRFLKKMDGLETKNELTGKNVAAIFKTAHILTAVAGTDVLTSDRLSYPFAGARSEMRTLASAPSPEDPEVQEWNRRLPVPLEAWQIELIRKYRREKQQSLQDARKRGLGTAQKILAFTGLAALAKFLLKFEGNLYLLPLIVWAAYIAAVAVHEAGHYFSDLAMSYRHRKKTGEPLYRSIRIHLFPAFESAESNDKAPFPSLDFYFKWTRRGLMAGSLFNFFFAAAAAAVFELLKPFNGHTVFSLFMTGFIVINFMLFLPLFYSAQSSYSDRDQLIRLSFVKKMIAFLDARYALGGIVNFQRANRDYVYSSSGIRTRPFLSKPLDRSMFIAAGGSLYLLKEKSGEFPGEITAVYSIPLEDDVMVPYLFKGHQTPDSSGETEFEFQGTRFSLYKLSVPERILQHILRSEMRHGRLTKEEGDELQAQLSSGSPDKGVLDRLFKKISPQLASGTGDLFESWMDEEKADWFFKKGGNFSAVHSETKIYRLHPEKPWQEPGTYEKGHRLTFREFTKAKSASDKDQEMSEQVDEADPAVFARKLHLYFRRALGIEDDEASPLNVESRESRLQFSLKIQNLTEERRTFQMTADAENNSQLAAAALIFSVLARLDRAPASEEETSESKFSGRFLFWAGAALLALTAAGVYIVSDRFHEKAVPQHPDPDEARVGPGVQLTEDFEPDSLFNFEPGAGVFTPPPSKLIPDGKKPEKVFKIVQDPGAPPLDVTFHSDQPNGMQINGEFKIAVWEEINGVQKGERDLQTPLLLSFIYEDPVQGQREAVFQLLLLPNPHMFTIDLSKITDIEKVKDIRLVYPKPAGPSGRTVHVQTGGGLKYLKEPPPGILRPQAFPLPVPARSEMRSDFLVPVAYLSDVSFMDVDATHVIEFDLEDVDQENKFYVGNLYFVPGDGWKLGYHETDKDGRPQGIETSFDLKNPAAAKGAGAILRALFENVSARQIAVNDPGTWNSLLPLLPEKTRELIRETQPQQLSAVQREKRLPMIADIVWDSLSEDEKAEYKKNGYDESSIEVRGKIQHLINKYAGPHPLNVPSETLAVHSALEKKAEGTAQPVLAAEIKEIYIRTRAVDLFNRKTRFIAAHFVLTNGVEVDARLDSRGRLLLKLGENELQMDSTSPYFKKIIRSLNADRVARKIILEELEEFARKWKPLRSRFPASWRKAINDGLARSEMRVPAWHKNRVEQGLNAEEIERGLEEIRFHLEDLKGDLQDHWGWDNVDINYWIKKENFSDQVIRQYGEAVDEFNEVILNGPMTAGKLEEKLLHSHHILGKEDLIDQTGEYIRYEDEVDIFFKDLFSAELAEKIEKDPVAVAAEMFTRWVNLQSLSDGNKRSGNLILNYILLKTGNPPFVLDEKNAAEYMDIVYPRGSHSYISTKRFRKFLREQLGGRSEMRAQNTVKADDGTPFKFRLQIIPAGKYEVYRLHVFANGEEAGFAHARFYKEEAVMSTSWRTDNEKGRLASNRIEGIYVRPDVRKNYRGVGSALLLLLMKYAQEKGIHKFNAEYVSEEAAPFYESLGFDRGDGDVLKGLLSYTKQISPETQWPEIKIKNRSEMRTIPQTIPLDPAKMAARKERLLELNGKYGQKLSKFEEMKKDLKKEFEEMLLDLDLSIREKSPVRHFITNPTAVKNLISLADAAGVYSQEEMVRILNLYKGGEDLESEIQLPAGRLSNFNVSAYWDPQNPISLQRRLEMAMTAHGTGKTSKDILDLFKEIIVLPNKEKAIFKERLLKLHSRYEEIIQWYLLNRFPDVDSFVVFHGSRTTGFHKPGAVLAKDPLYFAIDQDYASGYGDSIYKVRVPIESVSDFILDQNEENEILAKEGEYEIIEKINRSEMRAAPVSESLADFKLDPALGRNERVILTVKNVEQSVTDERVMKQLEQRHNVDKVVGGVTARPYKQGLVVAADFSEDRIDLDRALWFFRAEEPHGIVFSKKQMALAAGSYVLNYRLDSKSVLRFSYPWFGHLHTIDFSSAGRLLVSSSGFDSLYEFNPHTAAVTWEWDAWKHGYGQSPLGHYLTRSPGEKEVLEREGKEVLLVDDPQHWAPFGLPTRRRALHLNGARYLDSRMILATFFHQGKAARINRQTGQAEEIETGPMKSPHGLSKAGRKTFAVTNTGEGHFLLLDSKFVPRRKISLAEMPGAVRPARLGEWLQNTVRLNGTLFAAVDIHRSRIWLIDVEKKTYREISIPRDWAVQEVRSLGAEWQDAGWLPAAAAPSPILLSKKESARSEMRAFDFPDEGEFGYEELTALQKLAEQKVKEAESLEQKQNIRRIFFAAQKLWQLHEIAKEEWEPSFREGFEKYIKEIAKPLLEHYSSAELLYVVENSKAGNDLRGLFHSLETLESGEALMRSMNLGNALPLSDILNWLGGLLGERRLRRLMNVHAVSLPFLSESYFEWYGKEQPVANEDLKEAARLIATAIPKPGQQLIYYLGEKKALEGFHPLEIAARMRASIWDFEDLRKLEIGKQLLKEETANPFDGAPTSLARLLKDIHRHAFQLAFYISVWEKRETAKTDFSVLRGAVEAEIDKLREASAVIDAKLKNETLSDAFSRWLEMNRSNWNFKIWDIIKSGEFKILGPDTVLMPGDIVRITINLWKVERIEGEGENAEIHLQQMVEGAQTPRTLVKRRKTLDGQDYRPARSEMRVAPRAAEPSKDFLYFFYSQHSDAAYRELLPFIDEAVKDARAGGASELYLWDESGMPAPEIYKRWIEIAGKYRGLSSGDKSKWQRLFGLQEAEIEQLVRLAEGVRDRTLWDGRQYVPKPELIDLYEDKSYQPGFDAWEKFYAYLQSRRDDTAYMRAMGLQTAQDELDAAAARYGLKRIYEQGSGEILRQRFLRLAHAALAERAALQGDFHEAVHQYRLSRNHHLLELQLRHQANSRQYKEIKKNPLAAVLAFKGGNHQNEHLDFWNEGYRVILYKQDGGRAFSPLDELSQMDRKGEKDAAKEELLNAQAIPYVFLRPVLLHFLQDEELATQTARRMLNGEDLVTGVLRAPARPVTARDVEEMISEIQRAHAAGQGAVNGIFNWMQIGRRMPQQYFEIFQGKVRPGSVVKPPFVRVLPPSRSEMRAEKTVKADDGTPFKFRLQVIPAGKYEVYRLHVFANGEEAGFAHARFYKDEAVMSTSWRISGENGRLASRRIEGIYVRPDVRKNYKGIGSALLLLLMKYAQEKGIQRFQAEYVSEEAAPFYQSLGFDRAASDVLKGLLAYTKPISAGTQWPEIKIKKRSEMRSAPGEPQALTQSIFSRPSQEVLFHKLELKNPKGPAVQLLFEQAESPSGYRIHVYLEGRPAGYLIIHNYKDELQIHSFYPFANDPAYRLKYRGQGISETLLNWLAWEAAKQNKMLSTYSTKNLRALHLYRSFLDKRQPTFTSPNDEEVSKKYGIYGHQFLGPIQLEDQAGNLTNVFVSLQALSGEEEAYQVVEIKPSGAPLRKDDLIQIGKKGQLVRVNSSSSEPLGYFTGRIQRKLEVKGKPRYQTIPEGVFRPVGGSEDSARSEMRSNDAISRLKQDFGVELLENGKKVSQAKLKEAFWTMNQMRPIEEGPVFTTWDTIPERKLLYPITDFPRFSEEGTQSDGVYLGFVEGIAFPVAIKIINNTDLDEVIRSQIYDRLGVGPRFFGQIRLENGKVGYVMQVVSGQDVTMDFELNEDERNEIAHRVTSAGVYPSTFILTPSGHLVLIDAGNAVANKSQRYWDFLAKRRSEMRTSAQDTEFETLNAELGGRFHPGLARLDIHGAGPEEVDKNFREALLTGADGFLIEELVKKEKIKFEVIRNLPGELYFKIHYPDQSDAEAKIIRDTYRTDSIIDFGFRNAFILPKDFGKEELEAARLNEFRARFYTEIFWLLLAYLKRSGFKKIETNLKFEGGKRAFKALKEKWDVQWGLNDSAESPMQITPNSAGDLLLALDLASMDLDAVRPPKRSEMRGQDYKYVARRRAALKTLYESFNDPKPSNAELAAQMRRNGFTDVAEVTVVNDLHYLKLKRAPKPKLEPVQRPKKNLARPAVSPAYLKNPAFTEEFFSARLTGLEEKEKILLRQRFLENPPKTLEQIMLALGGKAKSAENARLIEIKALRKAEEYDQYRFGKNPGPESPFQALGFFSGRVRMAFKTLNITTVRDLTGKTEAEFLALENFGMKSLNEVKKILAVYGLSLKTENGGGTSTPKTLGRPELRSEMRNDKELPLHANGNREIHPGVTATVRLSETVPQRILFDAAQGDESYSGVMLSLANLGIRRKGDDIIFEYHPLNGEDLTAVLRPGESGEIYQKDGQLQFFGRQRPLSPEMSKAISSQPVVFENPGDGSLIVQNKSVMILYADKDFEPYNPMVELTKKLRELEKRAGRISPNGRYRLVSADNGVLTVEDLQDGSLSELPFGEEQNWLNAFILDFRFTNDGTKIYVIKESGIYRDTDGDVQVNRYAFSVFFDNDGKIIFGEAGRNLLRHHEIAGHTGYTSPLYRFVPSAYGDDILVSFDDYHLKDPNARNRTSFAFGLTMSHIFEPDYILWSHFARYPYAEGKYPQIFLSRNTVLVRSTRDPLFAAIGTIARNPNGSAAGFGLRQIPAEEADRLFIENGGDIKAQIAQLQARINALNRSEIRSETAVRRVAIALAPDMPQQFITRSMDEAVIRRLISDFRRNRAELREKLFAQTEISRFDAISILMNDLDTNLPQIAPGAAARRFTIGAALGQNAGLDFLEGFLDGLDKDLVDELLKEGRLTREFEEGLKKLGIRPREVRVERTNTIQSEQKEVPAAFLENKNKIDGMFLPLFLNPEELAELQKRNPEAARWLGKMTSRALIHLADLSQEPSLRNHPQELRDQLLRRLNLFESGFENLVILTGRNGRLQFGIDTVLAEKLFESRVRKTLEAAA